MSQLDADSLEEMFYISWHMEKHLEERDVPQLLKGSDIILAFADTAASLRTHGT